MTTNRFMVHPRPILDQTTHDYTSGMISSEGEEVTFNKVLVPADAKGMVEKWLDQVGRMMIASLRKVSWWFTNQRLTG